MTTTMKLLSRSEVGAAIIALGRIEGLLDQAPHGVARDVLREVREARDTIAEILPGGLFAWCESCEGPIGNEESFGSDPDGDCYMCPDCVAKYNTPVAA